MSCAFFCGASYMRKGSFEVINPLTQQKTTLCRVYFIQKDTCLLSVAKKDLRQKRRIITSCSKRSCLYLFIAQCRSITIVITLIIDRTCIKYTSILSTQGIWRKGMKKRKRLIFVRLLLDYETCTGWSTAVKKKVLNSLI